jgi:acyl transferase domain-containing protein/phosphopantetheinyl transferase (holo-ACP synthase)
MTAASRDIAIVGMACIFPGADNPARFWANIRDGLEFIGDPVPSWGADRYLGSQGSNIIATARGGYLGDRFAADLTSLGIMPSSVDGGEPDQFLALAIAQAALADAGADTPGCDHSRTGIVLGHSSYLHRGTGTIVQHGVVLDQTRAILAQILPGADPALLDRIRAEMEKALPPFNADIAPGLSPNVMTGRIANRLDLYGPNYIIDAACASSLIAVQAAMDDLRAGRSDLMLAGGVNASLPAEVYMVFHRLGALSGKGNVRPFTQGGDGTLLGEGLGILALKRLDDARADGDRIYAVLRGIGQSSDGRGAGLLAPRMEGAVHAIRRAVTDAGQDPAAPDLPGLIEAHGTGIPLGEKTELAALATVFGSRAATGLPVTAIGSVKSMIGHCIPAAGAAGLIKASLALYHRTLPPTLCGPLRAGMALEETPLYVSTTARPWIAPPGTLRRAAVNAFGFGGVNGHAILEEAPLSAATEPSPTHWTAELLCLSADTPAALAARVRALSDALPRHPKAPLSTIAAATSTDAGTGPCRLALVAESRDDLADKLAKAIERLDAGRADFRLRSGVFAADRPVEGRLAFLFPGEGAQYQGMLAEILMAFPAARQWFDFWDALFPDRALPPSAAVFPPPTTLSADLSKTLADNLFGLELGSESMFIAAQALMAVLTRLGISPDVLVGHSSGEHSALAAAGVLGTITDHDAFATRIRALNRLYQAIEAEGGIAGGALLTVGGIDRAELLALTETDTSVHLALDNCIHQAVLYGSRARMEELAADFRTRGGITAFLPFDRPYHTPLFAAVADKVAEVYATMDFRPPALPVWSCMTAAPMPTDPILIREVAAGQWASRVRFHETVTALHDDGVRLFLEVGPSANLTGFVEDALKGRPALALSLDSRRRGGLSHFLQAIGRLWVAGRDVDLPALFADRAIPALDLAAPARPDRARPIANTLPFIRLPEDVAADIAARLAPALPVSMAPALAPAPTLDAQPGPAPEVTASGGDYFAVMQQFLDLQGHVMSAALGAPAAMPDPDQAETEPDSTVWTPPLLHRIETTPAGLRAESDFDPLTDPFLAHHVLYAAQVSDTDPALQALPVLPLAVSLEMAVEAAACLTGTVGGALARVRARDWIAFDDGPATLTTEAALLPDGTTVAVRILRGENLLFEAEVLPEAANPAPLPPLARPEPSRWPDEDRYTTGMFHGPLFQGIAHILAWEPATGATGGLDADLQDLPLDGFFGDGTNPAGLLLNPALLDQIGHVTAFWIAQGAGTDFSSFPSSIDRIDLYDARLESTAGARIAGRISFRDAADAPAAGPEEARFLQGDFLCTDAGGTPLFRATGWRDRFFRVPHAFYEARYLPREAWYGAPLSDPFGSTPADTLLWSVPAFPPGFLEDAGGIWMRVLAATVLSATERETFRRLTGPGPGAGKRRRDWLMGRLALKEAARAFMLDRDGVACLPADLVIATTPEGKPHLDPAALALLGLSAPPELSLSHAGGAALAVAAPPGQAVGIDMEHLGRVAPDLLAEGAFSPAEQGLLGNAADRLLAGWCAKEAVAKALGQGLNGRPRAFTLTAFDGATARVIAPSGTAHDVTLARQGDAVMALARIAT